MKSSCGPFSIVTWMFNFSSTMAVGQQHSLVETGERPQLMAVQVMMMLLLYQVNEELNRILHSTIRKTILTQWSISFWKDTSERILWSETIAVLFAMIIVVRMKMWLQHQVMKAKTKHPSIDLKRTALFLSLLELPLNCKVSGITICLHCHLCWLLLDFMQLQMMFAFVCTA